MRVFILTLGTRGDFELFCTLAGRAARPCVLGASGFTRRLPRPPDWNDTDRRRYARRAGRSAALAGRKRRPPAPRPPMLPAGCAPQPQSAHAEIARMSASSDYFISNLKMVSARWRRAARCAVSYDPPCSRVWPAPAVQKRGGRILEIVAMSRHWSTSKGAGAPSSAPDSGPQRCASLTPPSRLVVFLDDRPPPVVMTLG